MSRLHASTLSHPLLRMVLALLAWGLLAWAPGAQAAPHMAGVAGLAAWVDGGAPAGGPFLSQGSARVDAATTGCGARASLVTDLRDPCSQTSADWPGPLDVEAEKCDHLLPPAGQAGHEAESLPWPAAPAAGFAVAAQDSLLRPPDRA